jgi:hypothetical protein
LDVGIQKLLVNHEWELDMGVQIFHIDEPNKPAKDNWAMI